MSADAFTEPRTKQLHRENVDFGALKGIVHPEIKIHSLSTHHFADGGVGKVFVSTKVFTADI